MCDEKTLKRAENLRVHPEKNVDDTEVRVVCLGRAHQSYIVVAAK